MLSRQGVATAAEELLDAYETRRSVEPLTDRYPDLTVDDAYAIQLRQVEVWTAKGATIRGHKVGLTSLAMQQMLGIDQPDYGHLRGDMFYPESEGIPADRFIQPRVEPETAFVLRARLVGPGVTPERVVDAIESVVPALEIIDSRIRDWRIRLCDTIADNASSGAVVLGADRVAPRSVDLPGVECEFSQNGAVAESGLGAAVLGNPLVALAWLANTLGDRGIALEEGHVVLPGACTKALAVVPGDQVTASFSGLGSVSATFV